MAKTKARKAQEVSGVADRLARMSGAVFADFTGVKITELEELRNQSRTEGCEYLVVKKTLYQRAAEEQGVPFEPSAVSGGLSILFGFSDPVAPAKMVKRFVKAHPAMRIIGGIMREANGFRGLDEAAVSTLGDLPSRDELRARLVGSIASPLRGMVGVLQGNLSKLVYVFNAIMNQRSQ